jgi:hypothetical protein
MRNLVKFALDYSVAVTEDDVLELGYDVTEEDFKAYFEIPEDAATLPAYKKHEDFDPNSMKPFMNTEEIEGYFITGEKAAPAEEKPKKQTAAEKKAAKEAEKKANADKKAEEKAKSQSEPKEKKPGVIASILDIITKATSPVSEAQILEQLVKLFPERESAAMAKTVKAQLGGKNQPLRMEEEKGVKFVLTLTEAKEGEKQQRLYAIAK